MPPAGAALLPPYHLGRATGYAALETAAGGFGALLSRLPGMRFVAALLLALAALIITCPCGLASADHAVLDKTGTLTEGKPRLLPGEWVAADIDVATALAAASRHPFAIALSRACPGARSTPGVVERPGHGMEAEGARLGSAAFWGVADSGGMALHLTRPGHAPVVFRFEDGLRADAKEAVAALRRAGLSVELLSGDGADVVARIAAEAGITDWTAGAPPEAKAARIAALREEERRVLRVDDGINDGAALAVAHVGAASGERTDLAQAIGVARGAQRLARQNIRFALLYNAVAVPVAIAGYATPLIAALVMASSLVVIGDSLRAGRAD